MNFLGSHGLGFDDAAGLLFANDSQNDFPGLSASASPMNFRAAGLQLSNKLIQILIQVIYGLPFRARRGLACRFPILELSFGSVTYDLVFAQGSLNEQAMTQVTRERLCARFEVSRGVHY